MAVRERTVEEIMLQERHRFWEVHRGRLREKPPMSVSHHHMVWRLTEQLFPQLDRKRFEIRSNAGRLRRTESTYYIPDLAIVPAVLPESLREFPYRLEVFEQPLPLVVEVWSPSTGEYDVEEKIGEYMLRGDLEVWFIHPFELTVTSWRRQPDGSYAQMVLREGKLRLAALPGIEIDLDALLA